MKRLHVHVSVENLARSVEFYSTLFAAEPTLKKPDYAKWMLDDPQVNFAISQHGTAAGVEHLGIQVETEAELREVRSRLQAADQPVVAEGTTTCCYHHSEKSWISDPQGVAWETFRTTGESPVYGERPEPEAATSRNCCAPAMQRGGYRAPTDGHPIGAPCCEPVPGAAS